MVASTCIVHLLLSLAMPFNKPSSNLSVFKYSCSNNDFHCGLTATCMCFCVVQWEPAHQWIYPPMMEVMEVMEAGGSAGPARTPPLPLWTETSHISSATGHTDRTTGRLASNNLLPAFTKCLGHEMSITTSEIIFVYTCHRKYQLKKINMS